MAYKKNIFFRRKTRIRPTFWGYLIIIALVILAVRVSLISIVKFLSLNSPVQSKTMVLEGWVPTYAIKDAIKYFNDNNYERLIITGIPIVNYEFIAPYKSTAEATVLAVRYYGYDDTIYIADIPTNILVDRTYNTAVETKMIFNQNSDWQKNLDIYSVGVHSRRTFTMFKRAFGQDYNIGIIAHRDRTFAPEAWWKSSKGFRSVSNEFLATLYVLAFFHPNYDLAVKNIEYGNYLDSIYYSRQDKQVLFADSVKSPFNKQERELFKKFSYFEVDSNYKIMATFEVDTSGPVFEMKTTTKRTPKYRVYGYLNFKIMDTLCKLTAYQNMDNISSSENNKYLFLPFTDLTNSTTTYQAGRYLDFKVSENKTVVLDFNNAYNPYCAYSERWSCPLVPYNNHLKVHVNAGEKRYNKH